MCITQSIQWGQAGCTANASSASHLCPMQESIDIDMKHASPDSMHCPWPYTKSCNADILQDKNQYRFLFGSIMKSSGKAFIQRSKLLPPSSVVNMHNEKVYRSQRSLVGRSVILQGTNSAIQILNISNTEGTHQCQTFGFAQDNTSDQHRGCQHLALRNWLPSSI